jgi:hypothetical protein
VLEALYVKRKSMTKKHPQRINIHQLEELSERFFQNNLPKNWTCEKLSKDYGVDLRIGLFNGYYAEGLELLVRLKSSKKGNDKEHETVTLDVSTYNHLLDKLQVVILVKYVEEENAAYWVYLHEVSKPNLEQKSFIVCIPKSNSIEVINWDETYQNIKNITRERIAAGRKRIIKTILYNQSLNIDSLCFPRTREAQR